MIKKRYVSAANAPGQLFYMCSWSFQGASAFYQVAHMYLLMHGDKDTSGLDDQILNRSFVGIFVLTVSMYAIPFVLSALFQSGIDHCDDDLPI